MLATLEQASVRGGKWHSLIDKVYKPDNLYSAYREVAANKGAPGVDNITIEDFTAGLTRNVSKLEQQLRDRTYQPQRIKRVHIPKPGTKETRPLAGTAPWVVADGAGPRRAKRTSTCVGADPSPLISMKGVATDIMPARLRWKTLTKG